MHKGSNTFFFSSRRRHTRSDRDWSSDVCSSDLLPAGAGPRAGGPAGERGGDGPGAGAGVPGACHRSGERRVGEECRIRWESDHLKKKNNNTSNMIWDLFIIFREHSKE